MRNFTVILPVIVACVLLVIFLELLPFLRTYQPLQKRKKDTKWTVRDSVLVSVITLAYGIVAFLGLGNMEGVQSFYVFNPQESVRITLPEAAELHRIRYFSGLGMGSYTLYVSEDGEDYREVGTIGQDHVAVFKWNDYDLPEDAVTGGRYLMLTAGQELWLGELALYDGGGRQIIPEEVTGAGDDSALFDEQDQIPERYAYENSTYFDEIYHARTAYEHIVNVSPYEISHPPLGKLILGLGIRIFGLTPFGWRFSGTLLGVLMLPALYLFLKKMVGGTAVPACCTGIFATDFMHFVQTRIATIDVYAVFFTILMYFFFWLYWASDREQRKKWLPPLALSGLCFGLGAASKWTCIYAGAGLAVLWLLDRIFRWKKEQDPEKRVREAGDNILWCLLFFVLVPGLIYYVSYWPYGIARGMRGPGMLFSRDYFDLVIDNQKYMFSYHSGVDATHPYSSVWWQWMLDIRPILYYLQYPGDGTHVSFGAWVNPMLCWGGLLAILTMVYLAFFRKDRIAIFLLVGYLAQLLPWVLVKRIVFEYHYFPSTVFLLLSLGYGFRILEQRHKDWKLMVFGFTGLSVALFALFYPELRGLPISSEYGWNLLRWMPTWPF